MSRGLTLSLIPLEYRKVKRTGLLWAFLAGGLLAAAVPLLNMAVRGEQYTHPGASPMRILMDANWQMMAMLNILLVMAGTCMVYHTEYADNGLQKMRSLPVRESGIFFSKFVLTAFLCLTVVVMEMAAVLYSCRHWFKDAGEGGLRTDILECIRYFGYAYLLLLPVLALSLFISAICRNMWISLGVGVVCVSAAIMIPGDGFFLSLFPHALPFRILEENGMAAGYMAAAVAETLVLCLAQVLYIRIRRR